MPRTFNVIFKPDVSERRGFVGQSFPHLKHGSECVLIVCRNNFSIGFIIIAPDSQKAAVMVLEGALAAA